MAIVIVAVIVIVITATNNVVTAVFNLSLLKILKPDRNKLLQFTAWPQNGNLLLFLLSLPLPL